MKFRNLGKSNLKVSEIGFGAWQIGGGWGEKDDTQAIESIKLAMDLGVTFIDTALAYGDGHSEHLIAKAIAGKRDSVVIASKVPVKTKRWPVHDRDPIKTTFPTDWIIQCTETSLKNLNIDCLDLQQLHAWAPSYLKEPDWLDAFQKLKKEGKIKSFGVSANDWDPYGTVDLVKSGLIDSIQVIYNIFEQRPAEQLLPAAIKHNVGIIARVPFEEGLLTGIMTPEAKLDPNDWRSKWLTPDRRKEAAPRVEALKEFLTPDRPSLAALALKFCLSHPAVSTVIPGMRRTTHVRSNLAASDGKLLTPAEFKELEKQKWFHGWPYPWANL